MSMSLALTLLKVSFCWFVFPAVVGLVITAFARRAAGLNASIGWSFFLCSAAALMILVDLALMVVGLPVGWKTSDMLLEFIFGSFPLLVALALIKEALAVRRSGAIERAKSDRITLATFAVVLCLIIPLSFLGIIIWKQIARGGSVLQLKSDVAIWLVQLSSPPIFLGLLLLMMMVRLRRRIPREYRAFD